jgi:hypothetical protein
MFSTSKNASTIILRIEFGKQAIKSSEDGLEVWPLLWLLCQHR